MNDMTQSPVTSIKEKTLNLLDDDGHDLDLFRVSGDYTKKTQEQFYQLAQEVVQNINVAVNQAMMQIAQQLSQQVSQQISTQISQQIQQQIAQQVSSLGAFLQKIAETNQQAIAEVRKPKVVSITGIKTDEAGRITDATINA